MQDLYPTFSFLALSAIIRNAPMALGEANHRLLTGPRYWGKQGKGFDRFYLAAPARSGQSAEVRIYTVQD